MITVCKDKPFPLLSQMITIEKMNEQQLFIKIGDKIKEIRLEKGISQQDLAAKCNFEKANMSRIEAGRTNLTIKNAYKISLALGVRLKDLLDVE